MKYIILLGAFQAMIVFSIYLITKGKKSADNILVWFLIWVFIHLCSGFLMHILFPYAEIHRGGYYTFISLIYPPLLWLYARQLSGRELPGWKVFLLFVPALTGATVYFSIAGYIIMHDGKTPPVITYYNTLTGYTALIMFPVYAILSLSASRRIPFFWQTEQKLVKFMAVVYISITFAHVMMIINNYLPPAGQFVADTHLWGRIFTYVGLLASCLAIGRVRILSLIYTDAGLSAEHVQDESFIAVIDPPALPSATPSLPIPSGSSRKPVLSQEQQGVMAQEIKRLMEEKKLYTDSALTLDKLAATMEISRHHVSEILNQYLGQSFYQYINEYRIREVVKLIDEHRVNKVTPNILSLAFEAGFHSKSSFNQYFKKVTGSTPSAYLKSKDTVVSYPKTAVGSA